jgi:hypothetical protein
LGVNPDTIKRLTKRNGPTSEASKNRVGRLKGYGNSINPNAGSVFVQSVMENLKLGSFD